MPIAHQDIVDRIAELDAKREAAVSSERARLDALHKQESEAHRQELDRIMAERRSVWELCGGVGHVMSKRGFWGPHCVVCGYSKAQVSLGLGIPVSFDVGGA